MAEVGGRGMLHGTGRDAVTSMGGIVQLHACSTYLAVGTYLAAGSYLAAGEVPTGDDAR